MSTDEKSSVFWPFLDVLRLIFVHFLGRIALYSVNLQYPRKKLQKSRKNDQKIPIFGWTFIITGWTFIMEDRLYLLLGEALPEERLNFADLLPEGNWDDIFAVSYNIMILLL